MGCGEASMIDNTNKSNTAFSRKNQFQMYACITSNDKRKCGKLIVDGFCVNFRMPHFAMRTPLHIAAEYGSECIVKLLLDSGSNPDIKDTNGLTPIFFAVRNNHFDCVMLLIRYGANLNVITKQDQTLKSFIQRGMEKKYEKIIL